MSVTTTRNSRKESLSIILAHEISAFGAEEMTRGNLREKRMKQKRVRRVMPCACRLPGWDVNNLRLRRRHSRRVIKPASPWLPPVPLSIHPTTLRPPSVRGNVRLYMCGKSSSDRLCDRTEEGRLSGNGRSSEKFDETMLTLLIVN